MSGKGYQFDDEKDEGIFADEDVLSAGDENLAADLVMEGWTPSVSCSMAPDGFLDPVVEEKGILDPPPRVDKRNFICLSGPCSYYTENARLVASGTAQDSEEHLEAGRWCGRLRTWAEQVDLTEVEIHGCTAYDPLLPIGLPLCDQWEAAETLDQSWRMIKQTRKRAKEAEVEYGVCVAGPCESFVEVLSKGPVDEDLKSRRYCTRLAGLGRLYDLIESPVMGCTGWTPITKVLGNKIIEKAREFNERVISRARQSMANRPENEE